MPAERGHNLQISLGITRSDPTYMHGLVTPRGISVFCSKFISDNEQEAVRSVVQRFFISSRYLDHSLYNLSLNK